MKRTGVPARLTVAGFAAIVILAAPAKATAAPLGLTDCAPAEGVRQCSGLVATWDGIPLDTTLTLPRAGARNRPLIVEVHGFGNSKYEYLDPDSTAYTDNAYAWAREGYAVLTHTARGLWGSCGTPAARLANPLICASGYIHLADTRYEVRDTQELIGRLVDEGIADPDAIGVTGDSYGGGQTLALAALRNRVMLPDGSLTRWRSPMGTPLEITAAAPVIPWVDLLNVANPNGRALTYALAPKSVTRRPIGVVKASITSAIIAAAQFAVGPGQPVGEPFIPGRPMGFLAPPGLDPEADVISWLARGDLGEPYVGGGIKEILDQLQLYRSAYYIDPSTAPPPLFLSSGFTDDLFPVDEVVRFANRTLARHPGADLKLLLGDFGHQRASNEQLERELMLSMLHRWFGYYLKDEGRPPRLGVRAFAQTCPRERPPIGPFDAPTFHALARGQLLFEASGSQSVSSAGGDPEVALALDPVTGGGDGCVETPSADAPGTAVYELEPAGKRGYTLLGSPTIVAPISLGGAAEGTAQLAARLWDVAPGGATQRLVARALYRPREGRNVFQLHPNGWRVEEGHTLRLELLGNDAPYGRPSNGVFELEIGRLRLRLPVRERPGGPIEPLSYPRLPPGMKPL